MSRVVIVGGAGLVGTRVAKRMAIRDDVSVAVVDLQRPDLPDGLEQHIDIAIGDVATPAGQAAFANADVVVHLASRFSASRDGTDPSALDVAATEAVLEAAAAHGVSRIVLLSSAMVYGASPANPIPLTEAAPLNPDPDFPFALAKVASEQAVLAWTSDNPERSAAILRPTSALAEGQSSWAARIMRASGGLAGEFEPPLQFLHLDDLADAVVLAATGDLSGVFNVAPDGWIEGYEVRQLVGTVPRIQLPLAIVAQAAAAGWRNRVAATPPGILSYTQYPWVIANDRLRAQGWEPTRSNEEVYVEGVPPRPWAMANARQRQRLAAGATIGLAALVIALAWWVYRWLRSSSR